MGRRRKDIIVESAADLRRLAAQYAGKPQQGRLLFLAFLKENPYCSIAEGAEAAGIGKRQGRYLWVDYQTGGLEKVLTRRGWRRKGEKPPATSESASPVSTERVAGMSAVDLLGFVNAVAELRDNHTTMSWAKELGTILTNFLPEVDYTVVSVLATIQSNSEFSRIGEVRFIFSQNKLSDGRLCFASTSQLRNYTTNYQRIIDQGTEIGFPFDQYHFPPDGFDFFKYEHDRSDSAEYVKQLNGCVGSILLFRKKEKPPFSSSIEKLIENLRPFFSYIFTDHIARTQYVNPEYSLFFDVIDRIAAHRNLSIREQEILRLLLLGNSREEVAELLSVTCATVNKHTRTIYRKAGVRRLSELFARYFTPRDHFPEQQQKQETQ